MSYDEKYYRKKTKEILVLDCVYLSKERVDAIQRCSKLENEIAVIKQTLLNSKAKNQSLRVAIDGLTKAVQELSIATGI